MTSGSRADQKLQQVLTPEQWSNFSKCAMRCVRGVDLVRRIMKTLDAIRYCSD